MGKRLEIGETIVLGEVESVLDMFSKVFDMPKGLPPQHFTDHAITLLKEPTRSMCALIGTLTFKRLRLKD